MLGDMSEQRDNHDWEQTYRDGAVERMPWYHPVLDPDLEQAIARLHVAKGPTLDLGTGPATQAIALAERGFTVTGADISSTAVERAAALAAEKGLAIRFVQDDVLDSKLEETFDMVFDRGCFHVFPPEKRRDYVRTVERLVAPCGLLFLKCFSVDQPGTQGPQRLSREEIRSTFRASFDVLSIEDTVYQGTIEPLPRALFCALRRH